MKGTATARSRHLRRRAETLLETAGIAVDGDRSWDMKVRNERVFARVFDQGSLGLGESYMDGWWDCDRLDEFFYRLLRSRVERSVRPVSLLWPVLRARILNLQKTSRAFRIGKHHYDLGNDLFRRMLDRAMNYSCGYWVQAADLDGAQEAKIELVCRKLGLERGMRVLDIGCGWGGALRYAAEHHGVEGVGITVSEEQVRKAREVCAGLPVEIRLEDYRDIDERFDRIFSIGMFEHVGAKNYSEYMRVVRRCLARDGLFVLHTIGRNLSGAGTDLWIQKYIFPNSMLPSARQIAGAAEGVFVLEDWHSFGADYDRTLMAWCENFEAGWPELRKTYDDRFRRMWRYYLLSCAGSFRARRIQLWQIAFSPEGVEGGYRAPR